MVRCHEPGEAQEGRQMKQPLEKLRAANAKADKARETYDASPDDAVLRDQLDAALMALGEVVCEYPGGGAAAVRVLMENS
jgi:hypothetical protein